MVLHDLNKKALESIKSFLVNWPSIASLPGPSIAPFLDGLASQPWKIEVTTTMISHIAQLTLGSSLAHVLSGLWDKVYPL